MAQSQKYLGLETEYAILFVQEGANRPSNLRIYEALKQALTNLVQCRPGAQSFHQEFFMENGGSFCYEFLPWRLNDGMIEGRTPECSNASELLYYQRAQEALLKEAIPGAELELKADGFPGRLGLIKNSRDALGNTYGCQENYDFSSQAGAHLKAGTIILTPLLLAGIFTYAIFFTGFTGVLLSITLGLGGAYALLSVLEYLASKFGGHFYLDRYRKFLSALLHKDRLDSSIAMIEYRLTGILRYCCFQPFASLYKRYAFPRAREDLTAFFVTRILLTGAGTLMEDGSFRLSEKACTLNEITRSHTNAAAKAIFDTGNLIKEVGKAGFGIFKLKAGPFKKLFSTSKRLQIGLSDSNRCDVAEYLKIGLSRLLLEMSESGFFADTLTLVDPVLSLHQINNDPSLKAKVEVQGKGSMTALQIQRFYYKKACEYLKQSTTVNVEDRELIKIWDQILQGLERDPSDLVGRIDWVTKRYLLEACMTYDFHQRKKIDIGYHELGPEGFYEKLLAANVAVSLCNEDMVTTAKRAPSSPERVQWRAKMIKDLAFAGERVRISWDSVQITRWWRPKVLKLVPKASSDHT